jgi:hypothetical protein
MKTTKEDLAISRIQVSTALWLLFMNKSCFKKNENKIQQLLDWQFYFFSIVFYLYLYFCAELDKMIEQSMSSFLPPNNESFSKPIWKCDICGKTSMNKSHIKNHVETHIEGVVHICQHCNKRCKTRESLRVHIHNDQN